MRAEKVQASLRIRAFSPEPSLLAHRSSESRETFRQKARSLAPLNGWACAVEICHDGMLEDTNSLDGAIKVYFVSTPLKTKVWKISRVSISITGERTVHWNWEQNTCIAKWMCTSADCKRLWKSPSMIIFKTINEHIKEVPNQNKVKEIENGQLPPRKVASWWLWWTPHVVILNGVVVDNSYLFVCVGVHVYAIATLFQSCNGDQLS